MFIDEVVDGCQSMFQHTVRRLRADVTAKLAAAGVDVSNILGWMIFLSKYHNHSRI